MDYLEYKNYLMHYGVEGQKWGIRRYQNADGSLTAEGRIHYGFGSEAELNSSHESNKKAIADLRATSSKGKMKKAYRNFRQNNNSKLYGESTKGWLDTINKEATEEYNAIRNDKNLTRTQKIEANKQLEKERVKQVKALVKEGEKFCQDMEERYFLPSEIKGSTRGMVTKEILATVGSVAIADVMASQVGVGVAVIPDVSGGYYRNRSSRNEAIARAEIGYNKANKYARADEAYNYRKAKKQLLSD